jgi:hypothetical protein
MDRWFRKTTQEEDPQTELARLASPAGSQKSPAQLSVEPAGLDWDLKELLEWLEGDQEFLRELWPLAAKTTVPACIKLTVPWQSQIFLNSPAPLTPSKGCSGISQ